MFMYMVCTGLTPDGKKCLARATLVGEEWNISKTHHICTFDGEKENDFLFENFLHKLVQQDIGSLKECYDKAKLEFPNSSIRQPYSNALRKKMLRWRCTSNLLKCLHIKTLKDFGEFAQENPHLFNYDVALSNGRSYQLKSVIIKVGDIQHVMLYDDIFLDAVSDGKKIFVDGTFAVIPKIKGVSQLLTIMVEKYGKALPICWTLMGRRRTDDYIQIFSKIKEIIPTLQPDTFMSDFEKGMRRAIRIVYPEIQITGCYFHYCQALYKNVMRLKCAVKKNKQKNAAKHALLKLFMGLAYLPSHKIVETFKRLVEECHRNGAEEFDNFIAYYEEEWINKVKPHNFSIYRLNNATNNYLESYHKTLKEKLKIKPTITTFLRRLKQICIINWINLRTLQYDRNPCLSTKKIFTLAKEKIKEYWSMFERNERTAWELVHLCSNVMKDDYVGDTSTIGYPSEVEEDSDLDDGSLSEREDCETFYYIVPSNEVYDEKSQTVPPLKLRRLI